METEPLNNKINDIRCKIQSMEINNHNQDKMVEIIPGIYLGDEYDASNWNALMRNNIHYILNTAYNVPNKFTDKPQIKYKRLDLHDNPSQCLDNDMLEGAFAFINNALVRNLKVLIHCQAGRSRSVAIVLAYLIKHKSMTLNDAYMYVKDRRPCICPNLGFMGSLFAYEKIIKNNE